GEPSAMVSGLDCREVNSRLPVTQDSPQPRKPSLGMTVDQRTLRNVSAEITTLRSEMRDERAEIIASMLRQGLVSGTRERSLPGAPVGWDAIQNVSSSASFPVAPGDGRRPPFFGASALIIALPCSAAFAASLIFDSKVAEPPPHPETGRRLATTGR